MRLARMIPVLSLACVAAPALAQISAQDASISNFRAAPTAANATVVTQTCGSAPDVDSVYERYERAVERRKCLERAQAEFIASLASDSAGFAAGDPAARAAKQAVATEALLAEAATKDAQDVEDKAWAAKSFMGFNWAAGVGYAFGRGPKRVSEAEVVNGIVRVKTDDTDHAVALLEIHHLFQLKKAKGEFGIGPFASVQAGGDKGDMPVGFGVGLAFGWHDRDPKSSGGFLLGVGYAWNQGVQTLGDGIVANQPLPTGETDIRYKSQSAGSMVVFVSRLFDLSGSNSK